MFNKQSVIEAMENATSVLISRYADRDGRMYRGIAVSEAYKALKDAGWKNVSKLDAYNYKMLGLKVIEGTYKSGTRPTGRYIDVVVIEEVK